MVGRKNIMKHYKPGQFVWVGNQQYRAKKRTYKCQGCDLNNVFRCPMVIDSRSQKQFDCSLDNIILKRMLF